MIDNKILLYRFILGGRYGGAACKWTELDSAIDTNEKCGAWISDIKQLGITLKTRKDAFAPPITSIDNMLLPSCVK